MGSQNLQRATGIAHLSRNFDVSFQAQGIAGEGRKWAQARKSDQHTGRYRTLVPRRLPTEGRYLDVKCKITEYAALRPPA